MITRTQRRHAPHFVAWLCALGSWTVALHAQAPVTAPVAPSDSAAPVASEPAPVATSAPAAETSTPPSPSNAAVPDAPSGSGALAAPAPIANAAVPRAPDATPVVTRPPSAERQVTHSAPTPRAQPPRVLARPRFVVMGQVDQRWNTAAAFDLYAEDNVTTFGGVALGYELVALTPELGLTLELGWSIGGTDRNSLLGNAISRTELRTNNIIAAAVARWDLLPWLAPHARLGLGLSVVEMSIDSAADDTTFDDNVVAPLLGLGVGASLQTPRGLLATSAGEFTSVQLGVRLELGYTLAGSAGFELQGDPDVRVPVGATSLGGLPRSGPHIHSAAFVRF